MKGPVVEDSKIAHLFVGVFRKQIRYESFIKRLITMFVFLSAGILVHSNVGKWKRGLSRKSLGPGAVCWDYHPRLEGGSDFQDLWRLA